MTDHQKRFEAKKQEFGRETYTGLAAPSSFDTFSNTLSALAQGLHVRHIATYELITCDLSSGAASLFTKYPTIDQIPAKKDQHIIGVFERNGKGHQGETSYQLRSLDDSILVAANLPLGGFLPLMAQPPFYRLVLDGTQISGIVTRSDLLKLPVRVLAFALSTSLETTMKDIISRQLPDEVDWLGYISADRQKSIKIRQADFRKRKLDLPLLDLTDYSDKYNVLLKHNRLGEQFKSELFEIREIRNAVAHGRSYAQDEASLVKFIRALERAQFWITHLNETYLDASTP